MGRSIHDIGHRLRWSDVKTIIQHLPAGSHFRAHQNPEQAAVGQYADPHGQILTMIVDELVGMRFQMAGAGDKAPPPLLQRMQDQAVAQKREAEKKHLSAAEIRRRVAASM